MQKSSRLRDIKYRKWIARQVCAVCKTNVGIQCCHVRMSDAAIKQLESAGATGLKPGDDWSIPMCYRHHERQHSLGEHVFYDVVGFNPMILAKQLRECYLAGDNEKADAILHAL